MEINMPEPKWVKIAHMKMEEQKSKLKWYLPKEKLSNTDPRSAIAIIEQHLSDREKEITSLNAYEIPRKIERGELTALQIVEAFCKRASFSTQLLSCCTEIMFDEALAHAKKLDDDFAQSGKLTGPLHGIPISIKDAFDIKGVDTTAGWTALADQPADSHAPVVDIILQLGGVIYCKTNLPASIMTADTENFIFGQTKNPYHRDLGAGGSSGGEGALIAARGSPLGIGSDVGGSIRIPALCCGIYGFRPSNNRFPSGGFRDPLEPGADLLIKSVAGPMANSVEDLKLLVSNVCSAEMRPWGVDHAVVPLPYRHLDFVPKKLKVGILYNNSLTQPHPPIIRALDICKERLLQAGHEAFVVTDFPSMDDLRDICGGSESIDGFHFSKQMAAATGEDMINSFYTSGYHEKGPLDAKQILKLNHEWKRFRATMNQWWYSKFVSAFDVLICPGAPHTAILHDTYTDDTYTVLWNCVDYPAGIIPVTKVNKHVDVLPSHFESLSEADAHNRTKYDPELLHGLPVCVQVVGTKFHEEELLESMAIIDSVVKDHC